MKSRVVIAIAALVLASSYVVARKAADYKPYAQLLLVPDDDRSLTNPLDRDPAANAAGKKLFDRHCATCHGAGGENGRKGPSLRASEVQTASEGALFWVITNGNVRAGMPVWSKLPEPQRWQIVTYLKSLGPSPSARLEPDPAPEH